MSTGAAAADAPVANLAVARAGFGWRDQGVGILPVGTGWHAKRPPMVTWDEYKIRLPTREELAGWLADPGCPGIGIVTGAVSGNLEGLEVEGAAADLVPEFISAIRRTADERGLDGGALITQLMTYVDRSPRIGVHWVFRVVGTPVLGNTKLASRPDPDNGGSPKAIIETRGEGGFFVTAPTPAACHNEEKIREAGVGWEIITGTPGVMGVLTAEEYTLVHEVARTFDEMPAPEPPRPATPRPSPVERPPGDLRPGDEYNERTEWADILVPAGWTFVRTRGDGTSEWTRPGKTPREGISATTGYGTRGHDLFFPFTTSTEFTAGKSYDKYACYTLLQHGGDWKAAGRELRRLGYGSNRPREKYDPMTAVFGENGHRPAGQSGGPPPTAPPPQQQQQQQPPGPKSFKATDLDTVRQIEWLASHRVVAGAVNYMLGAEGIGKSLWLVWLIALITTGRAFPEFGIPARSPRVVVLVLTEDDWATVARPRLEVAGADLDHVRVICIDKDGSGSPVFPDHIAVVRQAVTEDKAAAVMIDAWADTLPAGLSVKDPQQARQALHPWKELSTQTGTAVLLSGHTNREKGALVRNAYGMTGELRKKARMTIFAQVDPDDDTVLVVGPEKSNLSRPVPASRFRIESVQKFDPTADDDGTVPRLTYLGESEHTARDVFADAAAAENSKGDDREIDKWLKAFLTDHGGGHKARDVYAAGEALGYSEDKLKRAKTRCRIITDRPVNPGPWYWQLPVKQSSAASPTDHDGRADA